MASGWSPGWCTRRLHALPRIDFSLQYVNNNFDLFSENYKEGLVTSGLWLASWGIVVAALLCCVYARRYATSPHGSVKFWLRWCSWICIGALAIALVCTVLTHLTISRSLRRVALPPASHHQVAAFMNHLTPRLESVVAELSRAQGLVRTGPGAITAHAEVGKLLIATKNLQQAHRTTAAVPIHTSHTFMVMEAEWTHFTVFVVMLGLGIINVAVLLAFKLYLIALLCGVFWCCLVAGLQIGVTLAAADVCANPSSARQIYASQRMEKEEHALAESEYQRVCEVWFDKFSMELARYRHLFEIADKRLRTASQETGEPSQRTELSMASHVTSSLLRSELSEVTPPLVSSRCRAPPPPTLNLASFAANTANTASGRRTPVYNTKEVIEFVCEDDIHVELLLSQAVCLVVGVLICVIILISACNSVKVLVSQYECTSPLCEGYPRSKMKEKMLINKIKREIEAEFRRKIKESKKKLTKLELKRKIRKLMYQQGLMKKDRRLDEKEVAIFGKVRQKAGKPGKVSTELIELTPGFMEDKIGGQTRAEIYREMKEMKLAQKRNKFCCAEKSNCLLKFTRGLMSSYPCYSGKPCSGLEPCYDDRTCPQQPVPPIRPSEVCSPRVIGICPSCDKVVGPSTCYSDCPQTKSLDLFLKKELALPEPEVEPCLIMTRYGVRAMPRKYIRLPTEKSVNISEPEDGEPPPPEYQDKTMSLKERLKEARKNKREIDKQKKEARMMLKLLAKATPKNKKRLLAMMEEKKKKKETKPSICERLFMKKASSCVCPTGRKIGPHFEMRSSNLLRQVPMVFEFDKKGRMVVDPLQVPGHSYLPPSFFDVSPTSEPTSPSTSEPTTSSSTSEATTSPTTSEPTTSRSIKRTSFKL